MTGRFTGIVLKHLRRVNLELDNLALLVTAEMVDRFGPVQTPVCAGTTLKYSQMICPRVSHAHVHTRIDECAHAIAAYRKSRLKKMVHVYQD